MRRLCGVVVLAVGLAGAALAVAAVAQTWRTAGRLRQAVPDTLAHVEQIADSVHQQGKATVSLLNSARQRVRAIRVPIDELAQRSERQVTADAILQTLDEGILQRLQNAEKFARSMQDNMRSMSSALLLLDAVPFFSLRAASAGPRDSQWRAVAETLSETADLLERVSQTITRARTGETISPAQLTQLQDGLATVDQELASVQAEVGRFSEGVVATRDRVRQVRRRAPAWINNAAIVTTVFFVGFGFSQASLVVQGGGLLRRREEHYFDRA